MRPGNSLLFLVLLAWAGAGVSGAWASELYGPSAGVAPFGMGRAYSAVADDWLALHYNPAGLAMVRKVDIQLFDLKVATNREVKNSLSNIENMNTDGNNLATALDPFMGKYVMAGIGNQSQITVPHFAVGIGYDLNAEVDIQNAAYPNAYLRYTKDLVLNVGAAVSAGKRKDLRVGAAMKFARRVGSARRLEVAEIAGNRSNLVEAFKAEGTGMGGTFGVQYRWPTAGRTEITSSFVWHDIGKTAYGDVTKTERPTRTDDNMVAGLAVRFPIGGRKNRRLERRYGPDRSTSHLTFAFDYSHMNLSPNTEHLPKHLHYGLNLDLPILSIQLGVNQTSLTFGVGFDLWVLRVNAATYGEELGSYAGQRRDRRYLLSVGSSMGFKGF